jgi:hypothetical protein
MNIIIFTTILSNFPTNNYNTKIGLLVETLIFAIISELLLFVPEKYFIKNGFLSFIWTFSRTKLSNYKQQQNNAINIAEFA